jgi:BirA family transcriptional regulator, biotin operon repressor / biotin---[acetyl-CoA-carboxylase] ligase
VTKYPPGLRKSVKPQLKTKGNTLENPSSLLLRLLLSASPYYVSGSVLADRLKMSRVGVWARISKLRKDGLLIEASQNRGYRLSAEPSKYNRPLMEAWIHQVQAKCKIFVHDTIDSTNSEVERLLANGEAGPFAVISNQQSNGRGRLGRKWYSPTSGNIHISVGFRPNVNLIKLRTFTLWQGVCIAELLRSFSANKSISLKWPNDLVVNEKKIAGMLTEASINSEEVRTLIFGIGINLNSSSKHFPKSLSDNSTSLKDLTGHKQRTHELSAQLIKTILSSYKQCADNNNKELFVKWGKLDALSQRNIEVSNGKEIIKGKAVGIDNDGSLKIKSRNGRIRLVQSGEVSVCKW